MKIWHEELQGKQSKATGIITLLSSWLNWTAGCLEKNHILRKWVCKNFLQQSADVLQQVLRARELAARLFAHQLRVLHKIKRWMQRGREKGFEEMISLFEPYYLAEWIWAKVELVALTVNQGHVILSLVRLNKEKKWRSVTLNPRRSNCAQTEPASLVADVSKVWDDRHS